MGRRIGFVISVYVSWLFLLLSVVFFVVNNINKYYKYILILCMVFTIVQLCVGEKQCNLFSKNCFKNRIRSNVPVVIFATVTLVVYMPSELYLNNMEEFQVAPSDFGMALLINAILFLGFYFGGSVLFLREKQNKWFVRSMFAGTLCGYIQNLFLNGHMMQMDGNEEMWSVVQILGNAFIWVGLFAFIVILSEKFLKIDVDKIYRAICIYISLVEVVTLAYIIFTSKNIIQIEKEYRSGYAQLTYEGLLEVSQQNNVVVFVLDWFDEQLLEQCLKEDEDFLSPLNGFTCYTNTTSEYAFTGMALPYLLTGVEWEYGMSENEYCKYAFENSKMISDISGNAYDIRIFTDTNYIDNTVADIANLEKLERSVSANKWRLSMLKCAKYKMAPLVCKNLYWYTTEEVKNLFAENEDVYTADNDSIIYDNLTRYGLNTNNNLENVFRFIHMRGAHPPFKAIKGCTDSTNTTMLSQAKGSMKVVFEYIMQMKKLGIYDKSTIIITADHGQNYLYEPKRIDKLLALNLEETSSPILFVKNKNQCDTNIKYSSAPVSHKELIAEIMQSVNPKLKECYGDSLREIDENEVRKRFFVFERYDLPYVKVMITGNVRNADNWHIVEEISLNEKKNKR